MRMFHQYKYVFQMQYLRNSQFYIFYILIQVLLAIGIVIGFTYLISSPDPHTILYLATGAPTLILIVTGLVILPQQIGTAKADGYMEFMRTWPVNRAVILGADTTIWMLITIPTIAIASFVANWMFHPGYDVSWTIIPALLLIALTSIGVGYGFSYALVPNVALGISQIVVFGAMMFSPVNFPIENLPDWLQTFHHLLPIYSMSEIMRGALAASTFTVPTWHYINLLIWCVLGLWRRNLYFKSEVRKVSTVLLCLLFCFHQIFIMRVYDKKSMKFFRKAGVFLGGIETDTMLFAGMLMALGAGALSFFSPCVLPIFPAYLSYITGVSVKELQGQPNVKVRSKLLSHSIAFLLGVSMIFIGLGIGASFLGQWIQTLLSGNSGLLIQRIAGVFIVFMGLFVGGWIQISTLMKDKRMRFANKPVGLLGTFFVGIGFAAGWTPCIGPIFASILLLAASNPTQGIVYTGMYVVGFALPFLILTFFLGSTRWISKRSNILMKAGGILMIVMGLLLFTGQMPRITEFLTNLLQDTWLEKLG